MTTVVLRAVYLFACAILGGFTTGLAATAILIATGIDYQTRQPIEGITSGIGMAAAGYLVHRHWTHQKQP